jgi:glycosyltransferase involved in cell wall biosynthesis
VKLAVEAQNLLGDHRGIGVYVRAMLARLVGEENVRVTLLVRELFPERLRAEIAREISGDRFGLARSIPRDTDVSWHPWNGTFFRSRSVKRVATIHDCVPFAFPQRGRAARKRQQEPFLRSAGADRILTDSEFSRGEIVRYLQVDTSRVTVIPLAADPRFTPGVPVHLPEALRERPYILTVGADDPRKNLELLAAAHRAAFPEGDVLLVCVSQHAPQGALLMRDVRFDLLRDLYRGALAYAIPSLYEGFGIPPIEAMRCGAPVVSARAASLPEVCGDAALYVDEPSSIQAWAAALKRIAGDGPLRVALRQRGDVRGREFSWKRTAEETLAVLRQVAGVS